MSAILCSEVTKWTHKGNCPFCPEHNNTTVILSLFLKILFSCPFPSNIFLTSLQQYPGNTKQTQTSPKTKQLLCKHYKKERIEFWNNLKWETLHEVSIGTIIHLSSLEEKGRNTSQCMEEEFTWWCTWFSTDCIKHKRTQNYFLPYMFHGMWRIWSKTT